MWPLKPANTPLEPEIERAVVIRPKTGEEIGGASGYDSEG